MLDQRFERVTLRDRNVVTANPVAIAELVDTDQIRHRRLKGLSVAIEVCRGSLPWCRSGASHMVGSDNDIPGRGRVSSGRLHRNLAEVGSVHAR